MRQEELRPVGTEFWQAFPVSARDCFTAQRRFLYRIVAHDELAHPHGEYAERLDTIAGQTRRVNGVNMIQLSDRMVEDYTFEPWGEIEWKEGETPHEVNV